MELHFDLEPGDDQVYVAEAIEQIDRIESGLLELGRDPGDQATLAEVFRAAHTLKGSAATIGHERMATLTHALEEVFGALRSGRIHDLASFGEELLSAIDVMRVLVDEVSAGHTLTNASGELAAAILDRLAVSLAAGHGGVVGAAGVAGDRANRGEATAASSASGAPSGADTAADPEPAADPPDPGRLSRLLAVSLPTDEPRLLVTFAVAETSEWASVRLLQALMAAGETGRLLGSVPSLEDIEAGTGGASLEMLLRGEPADVDDLMGRLGAFEDAIRVDAVRLDDLPPAPLLLPVDPDREALPSRRVTAHTIRVEVGQLDDLMNLVGELIVQKTRLRRQARQLTARFGEDPLATEADDGARQFAQIVDSLQAGVTALRMMPIETVFNRFPRLVHDLSGQLGKDVDLVLEGRQTELDRSLLEEIGDPIAHIVRNALDHGIEAPAVRLAAGKAERGRIRIAARHADGRVLIEIEDDGRGMDPIALAAAAVSRGLIDSVAASALSGADALRLVFLAGFSTATEVTNVSGRGVGMDVVLTNVHRLGGQVSIDSTPGVGTTITMSLPLTLAILEALLVRSGDRVCAIPLGAVVETRRLPRGDVRMIAGRPVLSLPRGVLPLQPLTAAMGDPMTELQPDGVVTAVLVRSRGGELALAVDEFIGTEEIVLKSLGIPGEQPAGVVGATILADGRVALVVDVDRLVTPDGAYRLTA